MSTALVAAPSAIGQIGGGHDRVSAGRIEIGGPTFGYRRAVDIEDLLTPRVRGIKATRMRLVERSIGQSLASITIGGRRDCIVVTRHEQRLSRPRSLRL